MHREPALKQLCCAQDKSPSSVWDTELPIFAGQEIALSGAPGLRNPPTWGEGFVVRTSGALSITRLTIGKDSRPHFQFLPLPAAAELAVRPCTGGNVTVEPDATLNMSQSIGRYPLRLFGRVTIAESTLLGEIAIEIVSPFLHVRNSTVRAAASATSAVGAVTLTESEFQHWAAWLDATSAAAPLLGEKYSLVTITLDAGRSAQTNLPPGATLGVVQDSSGQLDCAVPGWIGVECLDDIDECADGGPGEDCEHLCVNTPGGYHCACRDGYAFR